MMYGVGRERQIWFVLVKLTCQVFAAWTNNEQINNFWRRNLTQVGITKFTRIPMCKNSFKGCVPYALISQWGKRANVYENIITPRDIILPYLVKNLISQFMFIYYVYRYQMYSILPSFDCYKEESDVYMDRKMKSKEAKQMMNHLQIFYARYSFTHPLDKQ